jgi:tripartite-type tricarboxylate transporter receptor subunit TctC
LPGSPNIVPLNQPGGGSISLANRLYNALPKDGTAIGMVGNSLYLQQFLGDPNIQFDAARFTWVGRIADLPLLLISWKNSAAKTPQDVFTKPYNIGVPGAGSASNLTLNFVKELVGAKYTLILGYQNGNETRLAMERGEVDATASIVLGILQ